jgi:hypothetical protein
VGRKLSSQAVDVLRATLQTVEQDPDLGEDNSAAVSELKRRVLKRVVEVDEPAIPCTAEPVQTSALGAALNLAKALVNEPAIVQEESPLDSAADPA